MRRLVVLVLTVFALVDSTATGMAAPGTLAVWGDGTWTRSPATRASAGGPRRAAVTAAEGLRTVM